MLGAALAGVLGALAVTSTVMARKVVTPSAREPDTRIRRLDTVAQTVTLDRTPDTALPGRYGLFTHGSADYLKMGSVLDEDADTVTRKLLTHVPASAELAAEAAFSGWYFDHPDQLHLPYTPELVGSALGPCPAWLFSAGDGDTWVIQVHGRGSTRAECLRAVPTFHAAGITSLVMSYRNDGEAPRSRGGTYALGAVEWRDVDAAIGFARRRGAQRIILMGWSMGGAIALQTSINSAHREAIVGLVLDSPVVEWRVVLEHQARMLRVPHAVSDIAIESLRSPWVTRISRSGNAIPLDDLDMVARAAELQHPTLILHSDDDGYVPSDASHKLAAARADLVDLEVFDVARHTKLWNYDSERWTAAITDWLDRRGLISSDSPGRT